MDVFREKLADHYRYRPILVRFWICPCMWTMQHNQAFFARETKKPPCDSEYYVPLSLMEEFVVSEVTDTRYSTCFGGRAQLDRVKRVHPR